MDATTLPAARLLQGRLEQALHDQWHELLCQRQRAQNGCGQEAIHDLRVASRRLRTMIELLAPLSSADQLRRLRRPLRRLTRELGQLRNLDEAYHYLAGLQDDGLTPLIAQLAEQRRQERRRIGQLLEELPVKQLHRRLEQITQRLNITDTFGPGGLISRLAERNLVLYRPIHHLLQLPELAEQAEQRHTLRIAIKKWRYFSELLAQLWARRQDRLVALLKLYQGLLGELNDREVFQALVRTTGQLDPQVRERVLLAIEAQHRQLLNDFKLLLTRQPLQYQLQI